MSQATPQRPILYIFSGLPGSGKSTLARHLARRAGAVYLRIDTIEHTLETLCASPVRDEGYRVAYGVAADNLRLGMRVVADSCNPLELTRRAWEQVAAQAGADHANIEVICSDAREHRRRVAARRAAASGPRQPAWDEIEEREYHGWTVDRIVIDTFRRTETECVDELLSRLASWRDRA